MAVDGLEMNEVEFDQSWIRLTYYKCARVIVKQISKNEFRTILRSGARNDRRVTRNVQEGEIWKHVIRSSLGAVFGIGKMEVLSASAPQRSAACRYWLKDQRPHALQRLSLHGAECDRSKSGECCCRTNCRGGIHWHRIWNTRSADYMAC